MRALPGRRAPRVEARVGRRLGRRAARAVPRRPLRGRPAEEALRLAVAAGAASTLELGAGRFDPREAGRLIGAVEVRRARPGRRLARQEPLVRCPLDGWSGQRAGAAGRAEKFGREGLTFDDVLLVPAESAVLPNDVSTATRLTRTIALEIPIVSAAMDTVTEARLAIALAREGGIGIIHRNLSIEDQVAEVDKVKRSESGMIVEPVTLRPDELVADALELMARYHISGVPITDDDGVLVGILTNRDLRFEANVRQPVSALMTARDLVTAPVGTTLEEANEILHRHKIEKLPVVDADGRLKGLITVKDIQKRIEFPLATKDEQGRLRVGAAVGVGPDALERAEALSPPGSTCSSSTPRTATRRACSRWCGGSRRSSGRRAGRRQHRDRRGGRGADRRGRGRGQGRESGPARSARRASSPASACRR